MKSIHVMGLGLALVLLSAVTASAGEQRHITQTAVCREEGYPDAPVVETLHAGAVVTIVDRYEDWLTVDLGEESCWIPARAIARNDARTAPRKIEAAPAKRPAPQPAPTATKATTISTRKTKPPRVAKTPSPRNKGGATAVCGDGSLSFSQHHSGTCSHHGGVAKWL